MGIRLTPEAGADIEAAAAWYGERAQRLSTALLADLHAVLQSVEELPGAYSIVHRDIRRALLRRFPYAVFFLIDEGAVVVVAVMHCARAPERWSGRR